MNVIINGEKKDIKENITIYQLLTELNILDKVMAVAVNMEIVKKDNWKNYIIKENDKLELLQFVGGG